MQTSSAIGTGDGFFAEDEEALQEIVFGAGSSGFIGEHASKLGKHALLVTDQGLSDAGHPRRIAESLEGQGIRVTTYDQSIENPTESSVQDCVRIAEQAGVDHIIGLGGGSSMDTAKGCNFILTNGGRMADSSPCPPRRARAANASPSPLSRRTRRIARWRAATRRPCRPSPSWILS